MGLSSSGIKQEVASMLECAKLCKSNGLKPLAIPESAILRLAFLLLDKRLTPGVAKDQHHPNWLHIATGILPFLRDIVSRETGKLKGVQKGNNTVPADVDSDPDAEYSFNPFGSDYYCKICSSEIANLYFQCQGCRKRLHQEFNICLSCYEEKKYLINMAMKPSEPAEIMSFQDHHVVETSTPCRKCNKNCRHCNKCLECSCRCHKILLERRRFYTKECLSKMLLSCEDIVKNQAMGNKNDG